MAMTSGVAGVEAAVPGPGSAAGVGPGAQAPPEKKLDPAAVGAAAHGVGPAEICDLVMKGGITSGVIYPRVVSELAARYRFQNIGGTSAGAIAAAATAAAEYGRRTGKADAFRPLRELPQWLGTNGRLLKMFRPDRSTEPIFAALMSAMNASGGGWTKLGVAARSVCGSFPGVCVLSAIPGLLVIALVIAERGSWPHLFVGVIGGLALLFLLAVLGPAIALFRRLGAAVPANFYGLTTGCDPAGGTEAPLTNWLDHFINDLAGKSPARPLIFGDLWTVGQASANVEAARDDRSLRSIDLEVVTSCLTHGKPYRFPFDTKIFYFDPVAWRKLFPAHIVDWMVAHERPLDKSDPPEGVAGKGLAHALCLLPRPEEMPVVVAARISLSFPLLISAVPLFAVDYTREYNKSNSTTRPKGAPREAEVCWFSDGGISSNFPIHFFDAPFPRWPTFAIDLGDFPYDHTPPSPADIAQYEQYAVWMPKGNNEGWQDTYVRFDASSDSFLKLMGFLDAIRNTMQNWHDSMLSKLPGYRQRIVHIRAAPWEGGYNLNMSQDTINRLGDRGQRAGVELAALDGAWWDEHRWTRYRSAMAVLEDYLRSMPAGYNDPHAATPLSALIARAQGAPPSAYPWLYPGQATFGAQATADLIALSSGWSASGQTFGEHAPRPYPELGIGPRV
jgi:predicted acylesterase/phospholipase RssA